jgi:hypothetical protein
MLFPAAKEFACGNQKRFASYSDFTISSSFFKCQLSHSCKWRLVHGVVSGLPSNAVCEQPDVLAQYNAVHGWGEGLDTRLPPGGTNQHCITPSGWGCLDKWIAWNPRMELLASCINFILICTLGLSPPLHLQQFGSCIINKDSRIMSTLLTHHTSMHLLPLRKLKTFGNITGCNSKTER